MNLIEKTKLKIKSELYCLRYDRLIRLKYISVFINYSKITPI